MGTERGRAPEAVRENIRKILDLEEAAMRRRSTGGRVVDAIGGFVGTGLFVALHVIGLATWLAINCGLVGLRPFDPYPFGLLSTTASMEAVILTGFVLMKQNRMARLADRRDHLDLQVNLLTEREASLIIEMLDKVSRRLGLETEHQEEAISLSRTSATEHLVDELHRHLPDEDGIDA